MGLTSSVLLAQVREPPHVAQAHREAHLGQDVLQLVIPGRASIIFWHLYLWRFLPSRPANIDGTALVVQRLLVCEQVSHRLCDMFKALLALRHLAVLRHWGQNGGRGDEREPACVRTKRYNGWMERS